jgi:outer membrane protein, protease secretion system
MRRRLAALFAVAVSGAAAAPAGAAGFGLAFEHAERSDPTFRAARQELESAKSGIAVSRAALLPNASLSISDAWVLGDRTAPNFFGQAVTSSLDYRAPQQSVSVRVPLYNREASQRVQQAGATAQQAEAQLAARRYELLERLGQAFLQRLYAEQGLVAASAQQVAAQEQRRLAVRRLELGEGTRQELAQAESELALADVQSTEAQNQVSAAAFVLAQIGGPAAVLPKTPVAHAPVALQPASLEQWLERAQTDSPAVAARRHAVEVARLGVERARSGHAPRLDLVASIAHSRNETVSTLNQTTRQRSLGVQLNMPLYAGGGVEASISQALADQERAAAQLDAEQQDLQADVQRLFLFARSGGTRVQALEQARAASQLQLRAARMALERGLGTRAEVLRADGRLADSVRELYKAQYDHLLTLLRLHARAGVPVPDIVRLVDGALFPS